MAAVNAAMRWWFSPMPRGRIAVFRTLVYSFVFVDVLVTTSWVARHAYVDRVFYEPLFIPRLLHLPEPTAASILGLEVALLVAAAAALTGRWPRTAGTAVFVAYLAWMYVAMSYGKVDHDRFAFLVALAVLPTAGHARWGDGEQDEAVGWAIRCVQVAVVLTYLLAAVAKLRFGGLDWLTGATLMRAVLRRGTVLASPLEHAPWVLQATQFLIVSLELASPALLMRGRAGRIALLTAVTFHALTYAAITIVFLPHVVCLAAFLPLERAARPTTRPAPSASARLRRARPSGPSAG